MGRSQSTPGLIESRGRIPLEDMWISPYGGLGLFVGALPVVPLNRHALPATPDSPAGSVSSSGRSSRSHQHTTCQQQSSTRPATAMHCGDSMTQLSEDATPLLVGSHEALEAEIKRLRERLHTVETENQAMSVKLNQQQWEIENRLAEIEMKICGASSTSSLEDNERNRESII